MSVSITDLAVQVLEGAVGEGGATDLSAYEGESISLTATGAGEDGFVGLHTLDNAGVIAADGEGQVQVSSNADNGAVNISASGTGGAISETAETITLTGTGEDTNAIDLYATGDAATIRIQVPGTGGAVLVSAAQEISMDCDGASGINLSCTAGNPIQLSADAGNAVLTLDADGVQLAGEKHGFFGNSPVVQPTGVAVSAAGIHAALVALGLITA